MAHFLFLIIVIIFGIGLISLIFDKIKSFLPLLCLVGALLLTLIFPVLTILWILLAIAWIMHK